MVLFFILLYFTIYFKLQSGTVGNPKGVMLSHDNLVWESHAITLQLDNMDPGYESIVSYLPLSHVAAQVNMIH